MGGYYQRQHRNGHSLGGVTKQFKAGGGPKINQDQFRLYADGTVIDQFDKNRIVGYITDVSVLDRMWKMGGKTLQYNIKEELGLNK